MLTLTPLVPDKNSDVTVHIVLNNYGALGRAYVETDEAEADEATIIDNTLSGQYSCPLRVVAFNTAEGWSRDVTEDIAVAVMNRARSEGRSIGKAAQGFWRERSGGCASGRLSKPSASNFQRYNTAAKSGHRAAH